MIYKAENPEPEPEPEPQPQNEESESVCETPEASSEPAAEAQQKELSAAQATNPASYNASLASDSQPAAETPVVQPQQAQGNGLRDDAIVSATYQCTGTYGELKQLSAWLRNSGIRSKAVEQKVIEP